MKQPTVIPRWWYMIFFVGAIALFIAGGALFGSWYSHASNCANSYFTNVNETWSDYNDCASKKNATYYAALACFVVAVIFKLIAWTLLILHCFQRRRYNQHQFAANYHSVPPMDLNQQPYGAPGPYGAPAPPYYAPPPGNQYSTQYSPHYPPQAPGQATAPMYPDTVYYGPKDANSQPSKDTQTMAHFA
ncbi:uncharacterized protein N7473_009290 [Penicillium subrubescens]|uniref:Uncharacterized protein n=1 Tax=Penicillium subrubescens TaxID=1316194 RepID=A0A1Q5TAR9_9EURO|nr:uncharacterized protein N7473_009290 [Penicillium subrubescens]KAJ5886616.1 hypothetical protein N7473_009290 [Penicillium subrubescens]OKO97281.1 hypothetical protein PENSUB_10075 [Penicillium subrubescens]